MALSSESRLSVHTPAASGMPLNIPGILVPLQLLWCPRIVIPSVVVKGALLALFRLSGVIQLTQKISARLTLPL